VFQIQKKESKMNFQELMARMAELDKPVQEADKADKDYDDDGKVESPKDEVWGSRAKAAAKSGKPFEEEVDETFEQGIEEIADEVDECGDMMSPMSSMPPKQSDNVSMNLSMNGSGSGGIRDLMNILRNLDKGEDDHIHHGNDDPIIKVLGKKEPMLGDASSGGFDSATTEPNPLTAPIHAAIPSGDDLHKSKDSFSDKPYRGDNPMAAENIKNRLASLYEEIKNQ
jgi:hypothetical protein